MMLTGAEAVSTEPDNNPAATAAATQQVRCHRSEQQRCVVVFNGAARACTRA